MENKHVHGAPDTKDRVIGGDGIEEKSRNSAQINTTQPVEGIRRPRRLSINSSHRVMTTGRDPRLAVGTWNSGCSHPWLFVGLLGFLWVRGRVLGTGGRFR